MTVTSRAVKRDQVLDHLGRRLAAEVLAGFRAARADVVVLVGRVDINIAAFPPEPGIRQRRSP